MGSSVWEAEISVLNDTKTAYDISRLKDITKDTHSDLSNLLKANPDIDRVSLADIISQQDNFVKQNTIKGAAPQTLLAAVSEKTSPTTPLSDNSISDEGGKVKEKLSVDTHIPEQLKIMR